MSSQPPGVNWVGGRVPWDDGSYIPSDPQNVPNPADQLRGPAGPQFIGDAPQVSIPSQGVFDIRDGHHYARQIISLYNAAPDGSVGAASLRVILENLLKRNYLQIRNASVTANIFVAFDKEASLFSTLRLIPNQIVFFDNVVPQGDVWILADGASGFVALDYATYLG